MLLTVKNLNWLGVFLTEIMSVSTTAPAHAPANRGASESSSNNSSTGSNGTYQLDVVHVATITFDHVVVDDVTNQSLSSTYTSNMPRTAETASFKVCCVCATKRILLT